MTLGNTGKNSRYQGKTPDLLFPVLVHNAPAISSIPRIQYAGTICGE